tara:strand:+ start:6097 stop:6327 length:231 start_codon:yes stop_codon:yes gene_type:complete
MNHIIKSTPLAQVAAYTSPGDLVTLIGDDEGEKFGYGVVLKSLRHTSLVRWSTSHLSVGHYPNVNLNVVTRVRKHD